MMEARDSSDHGTQFFGTRVSLLSRAQTSNVSRGVEAAREYQGVSFVCSSIVLAVLHSTCVPTETMASSFRLEGYMRKMGYSHTNWKRRFAVLDGDRVTYFGSDSDVRKGKAPKGIARLISVTSVRPVEGGHHICANDSYARKEYVKNVIQPKVLDPQPFCLELSRAARESKESTDKAPDGTKERTFYFSLDSELSRQRWLACLRTALQTLFHAEADSKAGGAGGKKRNEKSETLVHALAHDLPPSAVQAEKVEWYRVHVVASTGTVPELVELGEGGVDILNCRNSEGGTPLIQASGYGNMPVMEYLCAQRVDVNARTLSGSSALHVAASHGRTAAVAFLLEHGADPGLRNNKGRLPRDLCVLHETFMVFQRFEGEKKGGEVRVKPPISWPPEPTAEEREDHAVLVQALEARAQRHATHRDWQGVPLPVVMVHLVASSGRLAEMVALFHRGHDIHAAQPQSGSTTTIIAAGVGNIPVLKFLIENGSDLAACSLKGNTALHVAARRGQGAVMKLLLHAGADPHAKNNDGKTPLDVCAVDECSIIMRTHSRLSHRKFTITPGYIGDVPMLESPDVEGKEVEAGEEEIMYEAKRGSVLPLAADLLGPS